MRYLLQISFLVSVLRFTLLSGGYKFRSKMKRGTASNTFCAFVLIAMGECLTLFYVLEPLQISKTFVLQDEARKFSAGSVLKCVVAYGGTSTMFQLSTLFKGKEYHLAVKLVPICERSL